MRKITVAGNTIQGKSKKAKVKSMKKQEKRKVIRACGKSLWVRVGNR